MTEQSIELDCAPGPIRPSDLIDKVIKGTGLELKEPVSMLFGNWTYDYSEVSPEKWKDIQEIIKPRIERLYKTRTIRYGSW